MEGVELFNFVVTGRPYIRVILSVHLVKHKMSSQLPDAFVDHQLNGNLHVLFLHNETEKHLL